MKVIVTKNYEEMSAVAADMVAELIAAKPDCVLGLATGSTPEGMYANLVRGCKEGKIDFSAVRSVNLDEYFPIKPENDQSYRYFMNKNLFPTGKPPILRQRALATRRSSTIWAAQTCRFWASVRTDTSASTSPVRF